MEQAPSNAPERVADTPVEELTDAPARRAFAPEASANLLTGLKRHALPAVVAAGLAVGILGGALTPARPLEEATAAVPVTTLAQRPVADEVSRSFDREPLEPQALAQEPVDTAPVVEQGPAAAPIAPIAVPPAGSPQAPAPAAAPAADAKGSTAAAPAAGGQTTMYATETVNVRSDASASSDKIGSLSAGDKVQAAAETRNGFRRVTLNGRTGWVTTTYLSSKAPTAGGAAASSDAAPVTSGACAPLRGVRANTEKVHQAICAKFGSQVSSYIGVRPDWDIEHPSGRALDAMVSSNATGWQIANFVKANASSLGVTEVIFDQKIWTTQRASEGWRSMSDRGSATANHRDHVHVSTR